jgi:hypothetical protein
MRSASSRTKIKRPEGATVTATIGVGPRSEGGFGITAELDVYLPKLPEAEARELVEATHEICPNSNAIKAGVDVKTMIRSRLSSSVRCPRYAGASETAMQRTIFWPDRVLQLRCI